MFKSITLLYTVDVHISYLVCQMHTPHLHVNRQANQVAISFNEQNQLYPFPRIFVPSSLPPRPHIQLFHCTQPHLVGCVL